MKRFFVIICLLLGFTNFTFAQNIDLEPGLYAIQEGDHYVRIEHERGRGSLNSILGWSFSHYRYKNQEAVVEGTGEFLLVCDMNKNNTLITPQRCDIFVKWFTPDNLRVVQLTPKKGKRVLYKHELETIMDMVDYYSGRNNITWEKVADNAYRISYNPEEGEYAFVAMKLTSEGFDPSFIWGFTQKKKVGL